MFHLYNFTNTARIMMRNMQITYNNSFIALACGDSYGSHYEFEGLCGCKFSERSLPNEPKQKSITDDTKMAKILYDHYLKYKTVKVDILTNAYVEWAKDEGLDDGIGIHTEEVLLHHKKDKDSQGNGALMRNIPFGVKLIEDGYSFTDAVRLMNLDSAITHENKTIFLANELALDLALNGLEVLSKESYKTLVIKLHNGNTAWVIHTLYIIIEALKKKRKFITGFKFIVSNGGDTDTNCAIFGAIFGTKKNISTEIDIEDFIGGML